MLNPPNCPISDDQKVVDKTLSLLPIWSIKRGMHVCHICGGLGVVWSEGEDEKKDANGDSVSVDKEEVADAKPTV